MRTITAKYAGECRKCNADLPVGATVVYEKRVGVFCPACAPTDPEAIREYRQEAADRRADKYDEWAGKREHKANAQLNSYPEIRHDWAFITQPGHIPLRAKMNKADDRAYESLLVADGFREKAGRLRSGVRVAGDRERKRESEREFTRKWIAKEMRVTNCMYGPGVVTRVNKKTASVLHDRCPRRAFPICLSWLAPEDKKHPRFLAAIANHHNAEVN